MDAHLTNDYLARAREIIGDRTDTEIEYDNTVVAFMAKGMDIRSAVGAANRDHPDEALKPDPGSLGRFGGTIRLHQQAQIDPPEIGNQGINRQDSAPNGSGQRVFTNRHTRFIEFKDDVARCGSTHLIQYPALDWPAFLRHSKTGQTHRLK